MLLQTQCVNSHAHSLEYFVVHHHKTSKTSSLPVSALYTRCENDSFVESIINSFDLHENTYM